MICLALGPGCKRKEPGKDNENGRPPAASGATDSPAHEEDPMNLKSPAFGDGQRIPSQYTCDGNDISPPLNIAGVPPDSKALVLVVDDPDAPGGTWDHWIIWNIPPRTAQIAEGEQPEGVPGKNDFDNLVYGGPCPPSGRHTYRFKLYALDTKLDLKRGSRKTEVQDEMEGYVLAEAILEGTYTRR
jgi:hypothetical protein